MEPHKLLIDAMPVFVELAIKTVGAILIYAVGRWLIALVKKLINKVMISRHIEPTLLRYVSAILSVVLNILLIITVLGVFGIQTTSFAAILAVAGLSIGSAWSGLLSNFAAGVFIIMFRPFKVGDIVTAGGVTGTVELIGMFATTITTFENVLAIVGNSKISSDIIQNYSANAYRRVDLTAQIAHGMEPHAVICELQDRLIKIEHVLAEPRPIVAIVEFNDRGIKLAVRPYCQQAHYAFVLFETNAMIASLFAEKKLPHTIHLHKTNLTTLIKIHINQRRGLK